MMTESPGLLAVWKDVEPSGADELAAWYIREHIAERVGVPGFRNANCYCALDGKPGFLALYDTDGPGVLSGAPYLERLHKPTPWTQRVQPLSRNTLRSACRIVQEAGRGLGGAVRAYRIDPQPGAHERLRTALAGLPITNWIECPGVVRVRVAESIATGPPRETVEMAKRGGDTTSAFVVLVDVTGTAALKDAVMTEGDWTALGAASPVHQGDYALMYSLMDRT